MPFVPDEQVAARKLWLSTGGGLPEECLQYLTLSNNPDQAITSSFKIASAAQTSIGLAGLAAAHFHELRTGIEQSVSVDARHAVLEFRSEAYYTLENKPPGTLWDTIAGLYRTRDRRFVRVHTNFPHHRRGILQILGLPDSSEITKEHVQEAFMQWDAFEFEEKAAESGMCAFALRSFDEWDQLPQGLAMKEVPPVTVLKIGDAPKRDFSSLSNSYKHPLENIKVLDFTRVLAGPIAGRTLAAHGADVLVVTSPNLPALPTLDVDTSRGKRTTQLDLKLPADKVKLRELVEDVDVFLQAYRPGALENKGFGTHELIKMKDASKHGIICANICAWGWEGPWKDRRGFDSLVQTATGFNQAESQAYAISQGKPSLPTTLDPKPFPVQALDHAAAYLTAYGINVALCKTITEGGSWEVRVSLAAVAQWLRSLGRVAPDIGFGQTAKPMPTVSFPPDDEVRKLSSDWVQRHHSSEGKKMTAVRHAAILSKTPVKDGLREATAPMILNSSLPQWLW
ncbi:CoA-transferase family III domain-containing protein [Lentinula raphanica]|nr:CoA-transferase family III domain-containing protein [Lentinula raphanica]